MLQPSKSTVSFDQLSAMFPKVPRFSTPPPTFGTLPPTAPLPKTSQAEARRLPIPPRAPSTGAFFPKALKETYQKATSSLFPSRQEIVGQIQEERQQSLIPETASRLAQMREAEMGAIRLGGEQGPMLGIPTAGLKRVAGPVAQQAFRGFKDLTTKFLDYAKGKTTLSRQEIVDFARRPELKKGEADLLNKLAKDLPEGKLPAQEFADSIRRDLLELKPVKVSQPQYSSVQIDNTRSIPYGQADSKYYKKSGKNYEEVVFESPITTNGSSHYPNSKNYFAHARGDEVVEGGKKIWREQEIQSDLLQKDVLEQKKGVPYYLPKKGEDAIYDRLSREYDRVGADDSLGSKRPEMLSKIKRQIQERIDELGAPRRQAREKELEPLTPFTNDRFGERIMRERIKEKASKGYSKYRLPTGETIGKIEGFQVDSWYVRGGGNETSILKPEILKVGMQVEKAVGDSWIITDILGDGRFKAVPKEKFYEGYFESVAKVEEGGLGAVDYQPRVKMIEINNAKETFDLIGKSNPQAKRYENWGKFLKNKYGGKEVTDAQGNSWIEIDLKKEYGGQPVEAFGRAQLGATLGIGAGLGAGAVAPIFQGRTMEVQGQDQPTQQVQPQQVFKGTNYDPYDRAQNRPNATTTNLGVGAAGIPVDDSMVAVSRKSDGVTGQLRLGTVIQLDTGEVKLVADLKAPRFNGELDIDIATPGTGSKPNPQYNRPLRFTILREGQGREDARNFYNSGQWEMMKRFQTKQDQPSITFDQLQTIR